MSKFFIFSKRRVFRKHVHKIIAVFLAYAILFEVVYPTCAFALTGGPSQPEVQAFEPVGTSDMVDLFSGDFKYNIPLLDVDGYPINISYHSGVGMDQEASMVGLGWNINPGAVNRSLRGMPDDFNGDVVTKELNLKPNETYGTTAGGNIEFFGAFGAGASLGIHYNNYNGIGVENTINLSLNAALSTATHLNVGLGITSSSDDGLSVQPSIGMSTAQKANSESNINLGLTVGCAFNSRSGLSALSVNASASVSRNNGGAAYDQKRAAEDNAKPNDANHHMASILNESAGASFNVMMPTYTPQVAVSMKNTSVTASFKLGLATFGLHPNFTISGFYSKQQLASTLIQNPAFGYLNAEAGQYLPNALMDFNREKDGSFMPTTPDLPVTNFTYDIYSVSGQGSGGSYRPCRSDMGNVFDPLTETTSSSFSLGGEVGVGDIYHGGFDYTGTNVYTISHSWQSQNNARVGLSFKGNSSDPMYEKAYFKEASEKAVDSDTSFFQLQGGYNPVAVNLIKSSTFNGSAIDPQSTRKHRDKRNQSISILSRGELHQYGLVDTTGLNLYTPTDHSISHHIGEITSLGMDGKRYVYGIAAYNKTQEETTFAVGAGINAVWSAANGVDPRNGLVGYAENTDNSTGNTKGLDNNFSRTTMPCYAHSFLLTAVLSPDYIDSDTIRGPSDNDFGNYTKFNYSKVANYHWRIPVERDSASYNDGLKSSNRDDKANYTYGEKELWYLKSIETKNYIAVFSTSPRDDARGVIDRNGGVDPDTANASRKLDMISLYSKPNYRAYLANPTTTKLIPIKVVHFEYNYSLCQGVPNNVNGGGKLTLSKIWFTYQSSFKGRLSPYVFNYSNCNPNYNLKGYDRWGNFKPNDVQGNVPASYFSSLGVPYFSLNALSNLTTFNMPLPTWEYPYVNQNKVVQDSIAQAWTLSKIQLPSGGIINVNYESDDYASVQNLQAMQMSFVNGGKNGPEGLVQDTAYTLTPFGDPNNQRLYFPLSQGINGSIDYNINDYINGIDHLYFRFLVEIKQGYFDYVSGYGQIASAGISGNQGWVVLQSVSLTADPNSSSRCSPVALAAIQFGRLNNSRLVWDNDNEDPTNGGNAGIGATLKAFANTFNGRNISDMVNGPNLSIYSRSVPHCRNYISNKSWIKLNNVNGRKLGGGLRVKAITMFDNWNTMSGGQESSFCYGQQYSYRLADGTSSGVASYEPQLGGDENPWKKPVFYDKTQTGVPNDHFYLEEPYGECFFPSPAVGYSVVTVQNLKYNNLHHNATGSVVHEFYTTKDFPTICKRTGISPLIRDKTDPLSILSLFHILSRDFMTASEGYYIENNDMNGKPKREAVYQEGQSQPISSVSYNYQQVPYLNGSFQVNNSVTTIGKDGSINKNATIGVFYDFVSDFRESENYTSGSTIMSNIDAFYIPIFPSPIPVPIILPSASFQQTQFRSAVVTKVINRFGILKETVATDLGSTVKTDNLAYDAETGQVLLTQTTNDFNDPIYTLSYPAYWYYDGMGAAYQNIGFQTILNFNSPGVANLPGANQYFVPGDELQLNSGVKGWVTNVTSNSITVLDRQGDSIPTNSYLSKVVRSGRRNQQEVPMAKITTFTNPLVSIQTNAYQGVVQASAMDYTNNWRTFCDCFNTNSKNISTNPFINGTTGYWKQKTAYLYLTGRNQSNFDNNTNIRKDGIFSAYTPFYKLSNGSWVEDPKNWTFTSTVTEFSPYGQELENQDALGRYSAATYGYNQAFPTAVAANARYSDIGADNFEDYAFSSCADNHFKFNSGTVSINRQQAHTGRSSIAVTNGKPALLERQLQACKALNPCDTSPMSLCQNWSGYNSSVNNLIKVSGGHPPYNISWQVKNKNFTALLLGDGAIGVGNFDSIFYLKWSYKVGYILQLNVTDALGCTFSKSISFLRSDGSGSYAVYNESAGWSENLSVLPECTPNCNGFSVGVVNASTSNYNELDGKITVGNSIPPYSFQWDYGNYNNDTTGTVIGSDQTINLRWTGDFGYEYLTVTDAQGCLIASLTDRE